MNKVLIGSAAIKHWFPDFPREPKDVDYALAPGNEREMGEDSMVIPLVVQYSPTNIATPKMLLTLKISHIFWNNNWDKHMFDINWLMNVKGVEPDWNLVWELKEFWTEHYGGLRRSNLKMTAEDFFNNAVECDFDHDYLHTFLCDPPTYTKVLKDGEEVEPDPAKYHALSDEEKASLFQEEVMVMAYERFNNLHYKKAYFLMYKKYIREHVPEFCLSFVLKNQIKLSRAPFNFIERLNTGLQIPALAC